MESRATKIWKSSLAIIIAYLVLEAAIPSSFLHREEDIYNTHSQSMSIENGKGTSVMKFIGLDFEVFGEVQGVFFRKYTTKRAKELGLKGWCMNTSRGTVYGKLEGEQTKVAEMKHWLQFTGSPSSRIEKAEFRNEKSIPKLSFSDFTIHH